MICSVTDPITSMPLEQFINLLKTSVFSDQEIAGWIRNNQLSAVQELELTQAIIEFKGAPVTGIIRTALRELHRDPPIPGDEI